MLKRPLLPQNLKRRGDSVYEIAQELSQEIFLASEGGGTGGGASL